jgi:hypothetical protein
MRLLALILALVISAASTAHAEKRVALVIGNAAYRFQITFSFPFSGFILAQRRPSMPQA